MDKSRGLWTIGLRTGLLALVLPAAAAPTNLSPSTTAEKPVALLTGDQKDYLYNKTLEQRRTAVQSGAYATTFCYGSPVELKWTGTTGECTVTVRKLARAVAEAATVREETVVWTGTTSGTSVTVYNLEVGAGYEWTVACGGASASATFHTEETAPRLIRTGLIKNLRDLGGWTGTLGGKTYKVRQNLIFRGGAADDPKATGTRPAYLIESDSDRDFFYNVVGLKNEVDLRNPNDTSDITDAARQSGKYKFDLTGEHVAYNNFSIKNNELRENPNFADALKLLTNPKRLPAYFHCKSGRDRTGTTAAVLLAVLGVSAEDIVRDYQTTSDKDNYDKTTEYQTYYGGFRNFLYTKLAAYKNANLSLAENAGAYLQDCGITAEEIETFRAAMLEGYAQEDPPEDPPLPAYDMSGVTFADETVTYNGREQSIAVGGTLPAGVSVTYEGGGTDVGTYAVTAHFTGDADHAPIADRTATLTISRAAITSATAATAQYTGSIISPVLTVKAGGLDVPATTGYTVGSWSRASGTGTIRKDVGRYYATVKGAGNFTGSTVVFFEIVAAEAVTLKRTVSGADNSWGAAAWSDGRTAGSVAWTGGSDAEITVSGAAALDVGSAAVSAGKLTLKGSGDLTIANCQNLTATSIDLSGLTGTVTYEYVSSSANKSLPSGLANTIKGQSDQKVKYAFRGTSDANGWNLGSWDKTAFRTHIVIDRGTHTWSQNNNGVSGSKFGENGTDGNPTLLVKDGATLNFTAKDLSGYQGAFAEGGVIRVNAGGTLNFKYSNGNMNYRQRLVLEPGSLTTFDYGSPSFFVLHGAGATPGTATEETANISVPASDGTAAPAILRQIGGASLCVNSTDSSRGGGCAIWVGENSKLLLDSKISKGEGSGSDRVLAKLGPGELEITGEVTKDVAFDARAGVIALPASSGAFNGGLTATADVTYRFPEGWAADTPYAFGSGAVSGTAPAEETATVYVGTERIEEVSLVYADKTVMYSLPPEPPPPPAEETIDVVEDQSVTRTLSFDEDCFWLFGGEQAFANASAELDIGYTFVTGNVNYHYMSTRKASEVTVTLAGVRAGEERIFVARRAADGSLVPMAIYTVKVTPRERTPYEKLCAAFDAGGEYALGGDVECPADGLLELGAGQSLKLDLNGHSILCHADGAIRNAGDLEILDSTASDPFAAHITFGEDELGAGYALIRNRPGATLAVDGVWIEAGLIDATGDYEFGGGNTAVLAQGGLVSVTGGGHLGGLVGIDVTGPADVFIDGGAEVTADTWRSGGLQLGTCVRFSDGDSSLTVGDALLESEGRIVQALDGSELEATFSGATLRSSRASAPFELADGATVAFANSSYEDLTAATRISQVTALANAGAALSVGAGCTLTVSGESVIGFLADGVTAEADGAHTWLTAKADAPEGEWAEISRKLGAEAEFANEPTIEFGAADVVLADDGLAMRVTVAVRDGGAVKAVDPDKVKAYFEATDDLSDWVGGAIGLEVTSAVRNADGTMEFAVKFASASLQAFVRIRVR